MRRWKRLIVYATAPAVVVLLASRPDDVQALLLGLGTGALVAAIALGVVLTYRGSGVVNFAAGAVATYSAYAFNALRRDGSVFLPGVPAGYGFGHPLSLGSAFAVALLLAVVLGGALHLLVFGPLRGAPPLTKAIAAVGVLLILQALVVLRFTSTTLPVLPALPRGAVEFSWGVTLPGDQLILTGVVLVAAALLSALFRLSRFGLATRAAAENERAAMTLGLSPNLLAATNWLLSTVLVAALGILVATVNGSIDPTTITLLVIPALAAALLARFASFWLAATAAFGLAMAQNLVQYWSTQPWYPQTGQGPLPGIRESLPLVVIITLLALAGRSLPTRGDSSTFRLPAVPHPRHVTAWIMVTGLACLAGLLLLDPTWRMALTNTLIGIVVCLSFVVLTGFVGQISLAQMAFAGMAGFALSRLAAEYGMPFPLGPLAGAVIAAGVGLLLGVPALRVRGVNLAIVTLAAAVSMEALVFGNPAVSGGFAGAPVSPPQLFGLRFGPNDSGAIGMLGYAGDGKLPNPWFGVFCLFVVVALCLLVVNLRRSSTGRRMLAVRGNERAAAAVGVNVAGTKLLAFGISAFIAGVAGDLIGYRSASVSAVMFGGLASLTLLAFAYLGGITSVTGAVIGGTLVVGGLQFTILKQWLGLGDDYMLLVGGLGLVCTAVFNPEGITGAVRHARDRLPRFRRSTGPNALGHHSSAHHLVGRVVGGDAE